MRGATGSSAYSLVAADEFQSTLLMRGATKQAMRRKQPPIFQSTLLMRGATGYLKLSRSYHIISIHAPHARSDFGVKRRSQAYRISIHAPHARSDMPVHVHLKPFSRISIHAPHARSDCLRWRAQLAGCISIHAPHARSDAGHHGCQHIAEYFNPRSSCEERPIECEIVFRRKRISIHAPHARSDCRCLSV